MQTLGKQGRHSSGFVGRSLGSTLRWPVFLGIGVSVGFCPLIDVGVAVFATSTQNPGNAATPASILRNARLRGGPSPGLTFVWRVFCRIDVGEVFYPQIDVGGAVCATPTSIPRNQATPTQIMWNGPHAGVDSAECTFAWATVPWLFAFVRTAPRIRGRSGASRLGPALPLDKGLRRHARGAQAGG